MDDHTALTDEEVARIRTLLTASARQQWLLSSIAATSRWIAIVIGAWLAIKGLGNPWAD